MRNFKDTPRAYSPEELAKDLLEHLKKPRIWYGHKAFDEIAGPLEGGKWIYAVVYPPVDFLSLAIKLAGSVALQGGAVLTYPPQNMIEVVKNRYGPQKFEIVCNLCRNTG